jgi:hypothetical protein
MSAPSSPTITINALLKATQTPWSKNDYEFHKQLDPKMAKKCNEMDYNYYGVGHEYALHLHCVKKESNIKKTLNFLNH